MGLISAVVNATRSTLGDQFEEYVECPVVEKNVMITRGIVRHGKGNKNPSDGVISSGSKIVIPHGWAMMLVDNGKITEFSSQPGEFIYYHDSESSIFYDGLEEGVVNAMKTIGNRMTFGGQTASDQRVYYVHLLNVMGNKFGSAQPKKIMDEKYGIIEVTFFGEYAYKVENPIVLVNHVLGANAKDEVTFEEVMGGQLKQEFVEQLTKAISEVMRIKKVSFGDMGLYGSDISDKMNEILSASWKDKYGLVVTDVAIGDINVTDASMERINKIDDAIIFSDAKLQSGLMASASSEALKSAAANEAGAMVGLAGMNVSSQAAASLMAVTHQESENVGKFNFCPQCGAKVENANFCPQCGAKLNKG